MNNDCRAVLEGAGMRVAGINPERGLAEIVEMEGHPFFIGVQFHPEFGSRPDRPHPLFCGLVASAVQRKNIENKRA